MEITVISEEENPMLHRTDVRFRVSHAEATPDRLAVRDSLAARLNKDANEVVVRRLDTKFGMRETVGEAKVYQGAEFAEDVEQDHMLARNKIGGRGVEEAAEAEVEAEDEPEVEAEAEEVDEAPEAEEADEGDEPEAEEAGEEDEPDDAEAEDEAEEAEAEDDASEEDEAADADVGEEADDADEETEE
jgi:small subunit ribosomal protein S24e